MKDSVATSSKVSTTETKNNAQRGSLLIAYLSVFIDMLGLSLIIPIIPFLAIRFGANAASLGYIYASYNGAQMISVPVTGWLSDSYGRKPLIMASLFGSFAGFLVQGMATDIVTFCMGRVITGIFGGSVPIVNAYIVDTVPQKLRPKYFAQLGAVIIVAFMFGPGIGAGLAQFTLQTPMLVACGIAGMGFVVAALKFKEPEKVKKTNKRMIEDSKNKKGGGKLGNDDDDNYDADDAQELGQHGGDAGVEKAKPEYQAPILCMFFISFCFALAFSGYLYFSGLLLFDLFGWESLEFGFVAMGASIWMVIHQTSTFVAFQKKFGKHASLMLGACFMGLGLFAMSAWGGDVRSFTGVPLVVLSVGTLAFGVAFVQPSITSITSRYALQSEQGSVLGKSQAIYSLGNTLGPLIWGGVYSYKWQMVYTLAGTLAFCILVMGLNVLRLNRQLPEHMKMKDNSGDDTSSMKYLDPDSKQQHQQDLQSMEMADMKNVDDTAVSSAEAEAASLRRENIILKSKLKQYAATAADGQIIDDDDVNEALQAAVDPSAARY